MTTPSSATPDHVAQSSQRTDKATVTSWAFWDWGSASFNAVIITFVFSVYLTDAVGSDLDSPLRASTWLSIAIGLAGVAIALLAPVTGRRADVRGRRKRSVAIWTAATVVITAALFVVKNDPSYFFLGLLLMAIGSITFELAEVSYFAMLRQVSTPKNVGRVSGFGWSMGYFGGIFLLLICYLGFIAGEGDTRGLLNLPVEGGLNIRLVAVFAALWFLIFALPVLVRVPEIQPDPTAARTTGIVDSYKQLIREIKELWQADRRAVKFLIASAVFRDGLAGVFSFGAILAVIVYGINEADVLLFGIAANVISALGALASGFIDDKLGPKPVIIVSLVSMVATSAVLLFVSGPLMFWIFGLILCLFVGPAQSASRTFLSRVTPVGREGQMFGLYATTGRAVSWLAPLAFGLFVWLFDSDRAGIVGIALVLLAGLVLLLPVKQPAPGTESQLQPQAAA